jgi:DNA-binding transcriptional MerR regulator
MIENMDTTFTLDQLSALTDLPLRTIRYYIQLGLVDRHEGDRKHARYTQKHLDQVLQVRALADQGMPLERIKHHIHGITPPPAPPKSQIKTPSCTSGVAPEPKKNWGTPSSVAQSRFQSTRPEARSKHVSIEVTPKVKTRPSAMTGLARGPSL